VAFFSSANGVSGLWKLRILRYQLVAIFEAKTRSGVVSASDSAGPTDFVGRVDSRATTPVVFAVGVRTNPDQSSGDDKNMRARKIGGKSCYMFSA